MKQTGSSETGLALLITMVLVTMIAFYLYYAETEKKIIKTPLETKVKNTPKPAAKTYNINLPLKKMIPASASGNQVIHHLAYSLSYDEDAEQAEWVIYKLGVEQLHRRARRKDNFREDPLVETESASETDYYKSGFDKGHLAPAGDMEWSKDAMSESFYLSNISPQYGEFNRGVWRELEEQIRKWAYNDELFIVVGPVLNDTLPTIGKDAVAVPAYFYKVVLDVSLPEYRGVAFLMKNEPSDASLNTFMVSIDSVESLTGIDFFPILPDNIEDSLEGSFNPQTWSLN